MANSEFTNEAHKAAPSSTEDNAFVYRLCRDALMIVSSMHRGQALPSMKALEQELLFVQGKLCRAALADPSLCQRTRLTLIAFQASCVHQRLDSAAPARACANPGHASAYANGSH